jgi:hypothetical protein
MDLNTLNSSSRLSSVPARMALLLSAWRINGRRRRLMIRYLSQARPTRSAVI